MPSIVLMRVLGRAHSSPCQTSGVVSQHPDSVTPCHTHPNRHSTHISHPHPPHTNTSHTHHTNPTHTALMHALSHHTHMHTHHAHACTSHIH